MQYIRTLLFSILLLSSNCGSSGGGLFGGGGNDNSGKWNPDPISEEDMMDLFPNTTESANQISLETGSTGWTLMVGELEYNLTSSSEVNGLMTFNPAVNGGSSVVIIGVSHRDVSIAAGFQDIPNEEQTFIFAPQGLANSQMPRGEQYFYGQYIAMDSNGDLLGRWKMEIYVNFDNITASKAVDRTGGSEIKVSFSDMTGQQITGTISDPNDDNNLATFKLYGANGQTIAGGYSSEWGSGIMIGDYAGSPPN